MTKKQEFLGEIVGTFILILLGCGSVAMVTLFPSSITHPVPGEIIKGGYTNVVFGWGLGVTFGIFACLRVSGAHLNPAVTLALVVIGKFPFSKVFHYVLGQFVGAMLAALTVFAVYHAQWIKIDPNLVHTAGVFATFPAVGGWLPGLFDQIVGTFTLLFLILMVGDYAKDIGNGIGYPFIIGAIVLAIGISIGGMNGYAINPARDLGPRLIALMCGFQNNGFEHANIWLIPVIGPIVGGILGAYVYKLLCCERMTGASVHTTSVEDTIIN